MHGSIGAIKFIANKQYIPSIIQIIYLIIYITIDNLERIIPDLYLFVLLMFTDLMYAIMTYMEKTFLLFTSSLLSYM